jgi:methionyl-tRNA formyltransferase
MRIALLCATRRGYRLLEKLASLAPDVELTVFSFREEPWEPPFLDDIRVLTLAHGGQFFEGKQLGSSRWAPIWESAAVDLMLAVSWRYMLPPSVFRRPRLGTFVFHDSLLPEYRGFAPTVWAILNGEDHTGVTLFEMAEAVDAGDIVDQQRVPIGPDDSIGIILEQVTEVYLQLLERNLNALMRGTAPRRPQDEARASYTCKRLPEDNVVDWSASTERVYNLIRAVSKPYPGAYTYLQGERLRVWAARRLTPERRYLGRVPGRVAEVRPSEGVVVLTGDGALLLTQIQRDGGPIVGAAEVLNSPSQTLGR